MGYLAGLLSHKNIKEILDKTCDPAMASLSQPPPTFVKNVLSIVLRVLVSLICRSVHSLIAQRRRDNFQFKP